jgi:uncharacterized protein HemX
MDADTIRGIVYLVLLVAAGAGLWIFILYRMLSHARRRIAALEIERAQLARRIAELKAELENRSMSDEELLDELDDLLDGL